MGIINGLGVGSGSDLVGTPETELVEITGAATGSEETGAGGAGEAGEMPYCTCLALFNRF